VDAASARRDACLRAGLAICFVPLPVHLLLATSVAVIWRLNIPVICGTTFLLNPFTAVPAYYLAYRVEQRSCTCRGSISVRPELALVRP